MGKITLMCCHSDAWLDSATQLPLGNDRVFHHGRYHPKKCVRVGSRRASGFCYRQRCEEPPPRPKLVVEQEVSAALTNCVLYLVLRDTAERGETGVCCLQVHNSGLVITDTLVIFTLVG